MSNVKCRISRDQVFKGFTFSKGETFFLFSSFSCKPPLLKTKSKLLVKSYQIIVIDEHRKNHTENGSR